MPHIWQRLIAAAAVLLIPTTGHAFEECAPFTVVGTSDARQIEIVDQGATEVFAGASGDIAWARDDNDNLTFIVNATCD
ncbi:MAG: hypothetical protein AAFX92_03690 [Pseudomonadota bacterium]